MSEADHEIKQYGLESTVVVALPAALLVASAVFVALRVYVRGMMLKTFGVDDWLLVVALTVFAAEAGNMMACGIVELRHGMLSVQQQLTAMVVASEVLYIVSQIFIKLALASFFFRVLARPLSWQRSAIVVSITIYTAYAVVFTLVFIFQCGRPSAVTLRSDRQHCIPASTTLVLNYIAAASNCIIDWILTLIPALVVAKVQIPTRRKVEACSLIFLGALGSIVSVVRLAYVPYLVIRASENPFHRILPIAYRSVLEAALGIIAMSAAALRPLFSDFIDKARASATRRSASKSDSGHGAADGGQLVNTDQPLLDGSDAMPMKLTIVSNARGFDRIDEDQETLV